MDIRGDPTLYRCDQSVDILAHIVKQEEVGPDDLTDLGCIIDAKLGTADGAAKRPHRNHVVSVVLVISRIVDKIDEPDHNPILSGSRTCGDRAEACQCDSCNGDPKPASHQQRPNRAPARPGSSGYSDGSEHR